MKRILIAFLLIFTLTGCADLVLPPQTPVSFSAACRDAATVVLATVESLGEPVGAEANITTPVTLKLVECYSRDHDPYDAITAHLAAGTVDGFTLSCGFSLKAGEAYFLFLNDIGVITGGAHLPDFVADSDPWEQEFVPLAADEIYAEFENLGALEWEANLWSDKTAHAKRYIFSDFQYEYDRHAYVFLATAVREDPPYIADGNTIDPDKSWRENWQGIM
ncbi:MAG: hypothetical protein E7632_11250, partial [Ruminococcaceae bacterium]|nr:hypothetical protein [Oscillospiraceae bacterium]